MENEIDPKRPLRILHVEDSSRDAELIRERLTDDGFSFLIDWATDEQQFTAFLQNGDHDLILADYHLPGSDGTETLRLALKYCPAVPFICVSGAIGEEKAVELLREGATDYVSKERLDKLSLAIVRALDEVRERTAHRLLNTAVLKSEERQRAILQTAMDGFWLVDINGKLLEVNETYCRMSGYSERELLAMNIADLEVAESTEGTIDHIQLVLAKKEDRFETRHRRKDGTIFDVEVSVQHQEQEGGRLVTFLRDISERKILENQLFQAQKMESVGRLAGGVAHDFNNMLGVIIGNVELAMRKAGPEHPLQKELLGISAAAERAAGITRQLLAFARKQTIAPQVLDLNETVESMLKLLRRLIGENIELSWRPGAALWPVKLDPSQEDQILANLCVNARDAITDVGKLVIETGNVVFNPADCSKHTGLVPGEYVMLAVSDNGCGMDRVTTERIFEPFFTTKGVGQGTGLGLAMVYGIVKQNNGFINVYSEPGQGTTFRIYLPRFLGQVLQEEESVTAEIPMGSGETVLVVEDEPSLLEMTQQILEMLEYSVLTAGSPEEAIRLSSEEPGTIHLLMTDVMMPGMNGRDLAERILPARPDMKCLFTSGYTADIIAHHGVLEEGIQFIQKPCSIKELAAKIQEVLAA